MIVSISVGVTLAVAALSGAIVGWLFRWRSSGTQLDAVRDDERAAIVAWLQKNALGVGERYMNPQQITNAIERGDYLKEHTSR